MLDQQVLWSEVEVVVDLADQVDQQDREDLEAVDQEDRRGQLEADLEVLVDVFVVLVEELLGHQEVALLVWLDLVGVEDHQV